jgi:hypothetical protein
MTSEKLEELRIALKSAGFVLVQVDENVHSNLWEYSEPLADWQTEPSVYVKKRIDITVLPLPLPAEFIQK